MVDPFKYHVTKSSLKIILVILFGLHFPESTSAQQPIQTLITRSDSIYASDPDSSFALLNAAETEAKKSGINEFIGQIAQGKARYFILVTDYQAAGIELTKAEHFYSTKKDYKEISSTLALRSILLDRIGEEEESQRVLRQAYEISKNHGDREGEINRLTNMTLDYIFNDQPDSAYYYLVLLQSLEKHMDPQAKYYLEQNQGMYYSLIDDHSKAVYYFQRGYAIADTLHMIDSKATILFLLSQSYRNLDQLDKAEQTALESYTVAVDNNLVFEERDAVEALMQIYELKKNYQLAYEYRGRLIDVDDRINKLEKIQKLKEDEYKLNLTKKENELTEKELEVKAEQLRTEKANSQNLILYFVVFVVALILIFTVWIYLRTRRLNRTIELSRIVLQQKNKEILDSINYARRIQDAILPPRKYYQSLLPNVFVFYRPKDIVAGDFYWFEKLGDQVIFAAADCTGHGVPGALVSVICHNALNRAVKEFELRDPGEILQKVSELVVETFVKSDREVKDGMDVALCLLNTKTNELVFSGANSPVWIVKTKVAVAENVLGDNMLESDKHVLIELRGNKQPVGHSIKKDAFLSKKIQLDKGDMIYMSTDGYADQFGGDKGKKLKSKFFKEKILQIQTFDLSDQQKVIMSVFEQWKGDLEQVDDVCVIGVKI